MNGYSHNTPRHTSRTTANPNKKRNGTRDGSNSQQEYTKIYNALKDLEEYNVQISVPEFVFIGFQSSGKTSAVSQAAKLAVGTMKHGTASRCPTRFKLICNAQQKEALIKVNGVRCKNEKELTQKTMQITSEYEKTDRFSADIIEVRIESSQVAELTFVDLPGLIRGDSEQYAVAKQQLDELTAHFLHDQNADGGYRYIPILVREPVDVEHDTHFEVRYIDALVTKYGGTRPRIGWKEDALFVVNKFDKQLNRSPAASLIDYMRYVSQYGETVLTIMNAHNENTAGMSRDELNGFVENVARKEEEKWQHVLDEFARMSDESVTELIALKSERCGVRRMNEILNDRMCEIVKEVLPLIEQQLELAEQVKKQDILYIMKQFEMCDPHKLKQRCVAFNNKFIKYSRLFYTGQNVLNISTKHKKTWSKEVMDFHLVHAQSSSSGSGTDAVSAWSDAYEIQSAKLQSLLSQYESREDGGHEPRVLSIKLRMKMMASAAINRIVDAWQCQVAHMPFPCYTDEDIANASNGFSATRQADVWMSIRNLVLDAVTHLVDSIHYFAEMMRYKLKENAHIIFDCTLLEEFGAQDTDNLAQLYQFDPNNPILKLLQQTLRDYKQLIDNIVDEFIVSATAGPYDRARILDKFLCEETINIGFLIDELCSEKVKRTKKKPEKKTQEASHTPPMTLRRRTTFRHINDEKDEQPSKDDTITQPKEVDSTHDVRYFSAVYGVALRCPVIQREKPGYDVALVRHLSTVFWNNIKYLTRRDAVQKMSKMVMGTVNHHNERVPDAIQCGVAKKEIQAIMDLLVDKTGIDVRELEALMKRKSTLTIPKAINDIDNNELYRVYGVNRKRLLKEKAQKIKKYKEFKKLKAKTLLKIYHIKNNQIDEMEKVFGDRYGIRLHEKDVKERRVNHLLRESVSQMNLNVEDFVLQKYKTFEDVTDEDDHDSDSSYDGKEKQEIEIKKRKRRMSLKQMDDEAIAIQKEMAQMQSEQANAMKRQIMTMSNEYEVEMESSSDGDEDDDITDIDKNLFRLRSSDNWDQNEVMKQKKEMEAHMVYLVDSHVKRSHSQVSTPMTPIEFIE